MNDIESYLPHRAPFLFVDEVSVKDDTIFAEHTFRADDWFSKDISLRSPSSLGFCSWRAWHRLVASGQN